MDILIIGFSVLAIFFINVPLGVWRASVNKFSIQWFMAIHLSVPVIVLLRNEIGLADIFIPLTLFAAMLGQYYGGKLSVLCRQKHHMKV